MSQSHQYYLKSPRFLSVFLGLVIICVVCSVLLIPSWLSSGRYPTDAFSINESNKHDDYSSTAAPTTTTAVPFSIRFPFMKLSEFKSKNMRHFWMSQKPSFNCPENLKRRVGRRGDGGKWVCGLENLGKRSEQGYNCAVYSFGISNESSFESEILLETRCSIYAYDPTVKQIGYPLKSTNPRIHFKSLGIAGTDSNSKKTLKTLMEENGHKFIDILKIDIEGGEYDSLEKMMTDFDHLPFGQLLVELHNWNWTQRRKNRVIELFKKLQRRGSRVFSTEPNYFGYDCCSELSFINLNYIDLFMPNMKKVANVPDQQKKNV